VLVYRVDYYSAQADCFKKWKLPMMIEYNDRDNRGFDPRVFEEPLEGGIETVFDTASPPTSL